MESKPVVFVVDDDSAARASVIALVRSNGLDARGFASAEDFLASDERHGRGCVVADMRMPGMSGLQMLERLNAEHSTLPVVIITGFPDVPLAVQAMRAGAVTFLEKPCGDQDLWEGIRAALDRESRNAALHSRQTEIAARFATLTESDRQVLDRLMAGIPNKSIATELDIGLRTVELRRATIMKKMQVNSLAELVQTVMSLEAARH